MVPHHHSTTKQPKKDRSRGATTVELALVLPVLLLVVFGAIEFSRLNMLKHLASVAAYEGARHGIVPGATEAEVQAKVNMLMAAGDVSNATITTTPSPITEDSTSVHVQVSVPTAGNLWVIPMFATGTITGECELNTERQES